MKLTQYFTGLVNRSVLHDHITLIIFLEVIMNETIITQEPQHPIVRDHIIEWVHHIQMLKHWGQR